MDSSGIIGNSSSKNASFSADGRYVAFWSFADNLVPADTNDRSDVFVHDRRTGNTERVSVDSSSNEGDGNSQNASISADGRYVAFESLANNLESPGNGRLDVFVHDRKTGITERVSLNSWGDAADNHSFLPSICGNGRFVSFESQAQNLAVGEEDSNDQIDVFVHDRWTGQTERLSKDSFGNQAVSPS